MAAAAGVRHMAHRFIVGEDPKAALGACGPLEGRRRVVRRPARRGDGHPAEADRYADRCADAPGHDLAAAAPLAGPPAARARLGRAAAAREPVREGERADPAAAPDAPERGKRDAADRLRPLLRRARERGAHLHIDMESMDSRDAVLELILELLAEDEFPDGPSAGHRAAGLPARLAGDADTILDWARRAERAHAAHRPARQGRLLGPRGRRGPPARLVGAGLRGQGRHRPQLRGAHPPPARRAAAPCASRSPRTTCARSPTRSPTTAGPAAPTATSSCRSCAASATTCRPRSPRQGCACALLPGRRPGGGHGLPRAAPAGEHVQRVVPGRAGARRAGGCDELLAARVVKPFANEPMLELRRAPGASSCGRRAGRPRRRARAACRCGSATTRREAARSSPPTRAPERVVAERGRGRRGRRRPARSRRPAAAPAAGARPSARRRCCAAAQWLRERRLEIAALEVRECAKPWPEADADVCEAIDFLEYYARGGARSSAREGPALDCPGPGERNDAALRRRAASSPSSRPGTSRSRSRAGWSRPAWPPATPSCSSPPSSRPACALRRPGAARGRRAARARCRCCPATATAGAALVRHPRVHTIAFTGSGPVGLEIIRARREIAPASATSSASSPRWAARTA